MVVDVINALENLCDEMNATFQCTKCDQVFSKRQNLEKHLTNVHEDGSLKDKKTGKFVCNYCESSFRRERNLTLHIRDDHEKENDDEEEEEDDEEENNEETVGFDVDIECDPNLMTYRSEDHVKEPDEDETVGEESPSKAIVVPEVPVESAIGEQNIQEEVAESVLVDKDSISASLNEADTAESEQQHELKQDTDATENVEESTNMNCDEEKTICEEALPKRIVEESDNINTEDAKETDLGAAENVEESTNMNCDQEKTICEEALPERTDKESDDLNTEDAKETDLGESIITDNSELLGGVESRNEDKEEGSCSQVLDESCQDMETQVISNKDNIEDRSQEIKTVNSFQENNTLGLLSLGETESFSDRDGMCNGTEMEVQDNQSNEYLINPEEDADGFVIQSDENSIEMQEDIRDKNESVVEGEKEHNEGNNSENEEFLINGESIVMDDIAFNILANTLEMTMETPEEESNLTKEVFNDEPSSNEPAPNNKRKNDDCLVSEDLAVKKIKEEPLDENILENSLEMTMETPEQELQLPSGPSDDAVDPTEKKIKEEPQDEIQLSGEPVFSTTTAPLNILKAELKMKKDIKIEKDDSKVGRKPRVKEYKPRNKEYNYPNVAKKLICSYCKQIFPSRPEFNDHMAADHPDILSKHNSNNTNTQIKVVENKVNFKSKFVSNTNTNKAKTVIESKKDANIKSISRSVKITHVPGPSKTETVVKTEKDLKQVIKTEKDSKEEEIIMNSIPKSTRIIFTPVSADGSPLSKPVPVEKSKISTPGVGRGVRITQIGSNESKVITGKGVKITQLCDQESKDTKLHKSVKITPASIASTASPEPSKKLPISPSSKIDITTTASPKQSKTNPLKKLLTPASSKASSKHSKEQLSPTSSKSATITPLPESSKTNPTKKLLCTYCKRVFLTRPDFNKHILEDHPDISNSSTSKVVKPAFRCNSCQVSFDEKEKYEQHLDAKHGHKCEHCNASFRAKSKLEEHKRSAHSFKCAICNQKFVSNEKLTQHMETHNIKCEQCPEVFKSKIKLLEHKKTQHAHKCEKCNARFDDKSKLEVHMEKHRFKCDKCIEVFDAKIKVVEHKKVSHTFICDKCKKTYEEKAILEHHIKSSHVHKCEDCGLIFDFKNKLEEHTRKEHNFKCPQCEEAFKSEESALEHEKEEHSSCETCEDEFVWADPDHSCYYIKNNVRPTKDRVQVQNLYFDYPASFI